MKRLLVLLALLACGQAGAQSYEAMMATARAECRKAAPTYPREHQPSAAAAQRLEGCDGEALYYGIGVPVDDQAALQCAHATEDHGLLMMLYANGRGIPRDFAVARLAACRMDAAPAEMSGRLEHLGQMEADLRQGRTPKPIDICDDITSGRMGGECAQTAARIAAAKRADEVARLTTGWPAAHRAAWATAQARADAFAQARGDSETDATGTARGQMAIDAQEDVQARHLALLRDAEAGRVPAALAAQAAARDAELNKVYQEIRRLPDSPATTVKMADIRETQRAWLAYRDAWVAFAAARYPAVPADAWRARLTAERLQMLRDVLAERRP